MALRNGKASLTEKLVTKEVGGLSFAGCVQAEAGQGLVGMFNSDFCTVEA